MTRRVLWGAAAALVLLLGGAQVVARVPDDDMAPSLFRGDLVVLLPLAPRPGDVVALVDPLDPSRWTLRRVEARGGNVRYDDAAFVMDDAPEPLLEMGRDADWVTLQEGPHLIRHLPRAVRWRTEDEPVPAERLYLGADNRDVALDSRWWGQVPAEVAQGVVVLRFGSPRHPWRGWIGGRS